MVFTRRGSRWRWLTALGGAVLLGGLLLAACAPGDGDHRLTLVARSASSGKVLWTSESPEYVVEAAAGGSLIAVTDVGGSLFVLSASSGDQQALIRGVQPDTAPAVADQRVAFLDSASHVALASATSGRVRWRSQSRLPGEVGIAISGHTVLAGDQESGYRAFDTSSGAELWRVPSSTEDGRVQNQAYPPTWAVGELALVDRAAGIEALDLRTGAKRWFAPVRDVSEVAVLDDGYLLISGSVPGDRTGETLAVRATDGEVRWNTSNGTGMGALLGVDRGTVAGFVWDSGEAAGEQIVAYDALTLAPRWSAPALCCYAYRGGTQVVVVDDRPNSVRYRGLSASDGQRAWAARSQLPSGTELRQVLTNGRQVISVFREID